VAIPKPTRGDRPPAAVEGDEPLNRQLLLGSWPGSHRDEEVDRKVTGDVLWEASETFSVTLSDPTNATIADAKGLGTILDND
jgi:hypothetical protein